MATVEQRLPAVASRHAAGRAAVGAIAPARPRRAGCSSPPMLMALPCVAAWPLLRTIYFSFTDASLANLGDGQVGRLRQLSRSGDDAEPARSSGGLLVDPAWWNAVWNTVRFASSRSSVETVLGMIVALVLNAEFRGRGLVRAAILIPWAIPTIVSAKMWAWMLNDQFGIINDMLLSLGLIEHQDRLDRQRRHRDVRGAHRRHLEDDAVHGAAHPRRPADDARATSTRWPSSTASTRARCSGRVTLPLIRPALMVAVIFRGLDALRIFDLIYVLTPNNVQTKSMSVFARENLFEFDKFAYGSAASTLLFLSSSLVLTVLYIWLGQVDLRGRPLMP